MVFIKALLTGLAGVSLCMANISGTITDTGTTPIADAVVQLEKGGQIATTGADGSFTLVVGSTVILPSNNKLLQNGLSARISGAMLNVTTAEQSAVEVAMFDLSGKSLLTVRKSLNAGSHSISLPYQGAGIYLYKVKSGNSEFVLKGNSVNGASSGNSVLSQGSSSNHLAKQAKATASINDVIASTKDGYLNYRCVIGNSDTSGIVIKMIANAGNVTDADGNAYQTVRIGTQVWTVENLKTTKYNDGTAITKITDSAAWFNIYNNQLTTPAYCYYNNTTNADSIKNFGALYNWYTVHTGKLAPAGWHVPTDAEWDTLQNYLITKGYNWDLTTTGNKIAKSLATKSDWYTSSGTGTIGFDLTMNNSSIFSALPGSYRDYGGDFNSQSSLGSWWSATEKSTSFAYGCRLFYNSDNLFRLSYITSCGFSVRLVRD